MVIGNAHGDSVGGLPLFWYLSPAEYDRRGSSGHETTLQLKRNTGNKNFQNNTKWRLGPPAYQQFHAYSLKQDKLRIPAHAH